MKKLKIEKKFCLALICGTMIGVLSATVASAEAIDRSVLPIQPPAREPITEMDARNVTKPERFEVKARKVRPMWSSF